MLGVHKSKNFAFTLTELLIAMGIIGLIAAITIPSLVNNIYKKSLTTELKNITSEIKQLAQEQMLKHKVYTLEETDFNSSDDLFKDENFAISLKCKNPTVDCWKTQVSDKSKVVYKRMNGAEIAANTKNKPSIVLKNGAILSYSRAGGKTESGDKIIGNFMIDVNGNEPPNVEGRDFYSIYITEKGKYTTWDGKDSLSEEEYTNTCKADASSYCFAAIEKSGWQMKY